MTDQPGYTRVPNALLELLPMLPDAECRVVLVIARKTIGWQKVCDVISYSQLEEATGMVRQGVINGIKAAIERGILKRTPSGFNNGYCYEIDHEQVVHEVDHLKQSTKQTSPRSRPLVVHEVDHLGASSSPRSRPTKEKILKKEKDRAPRKNAGAPHPKNEHTNGIEPTPHQAIMRAYSDALGYPMKDGPAAGVAAKWLVEHGYTAEQVAECYRDEKARDFWKGKHLSLQSLAKCIGAWAQARQKKAEQRTPEGWTDVKDLKYK